MAVPRRVVVDISRTRYDVVQLAVQAQEGWSCHRFEKEVGGDVASLSSTMTHVAAGNRMAPLHAQREQLPLLSENTESHPHPNDSRAPVRFRQQSEDPKHEEGSSTGNRSMKNTGSGLTDGAKTRLASLSDEEGAHPSDFFGLSSQEDEQEGQGTGGGKEMVKARKKGGGGHQTEMDALHEAEQRRPPKELLISPYALSRPDIPSTTTVQGVTTRAGVTPSALLPPQIVWQDKSITRDTLAPLLFYQRINHFLGMHTIARKAQLFSRLMKVLRKYLRPYCLTHGMEHPRGDGEKENDGGEDDCPLGNGGVDSSSAMPIAPVTVLPISSPTTPSTVAPLSSDRGSRRRTTGSPTTTAERQAPPPPPRIPSCSSAARRSLPTPTTRGRVDPLLLQASHFFSPSTWKNLCDTLEGFTPESFSTLSDLSLLTRYEAEVAIQTTPHTSFSSTPRAGHHDPNLPYFFILKPNTSCEGKGIRLTPSPTTALTTEEQHQKRESLIQVYVDRPLLVEKKKFDLRIYVLLTSVASPSFWCSARYPTGIREGHEKGGGDGEKRRSGNGQGKPVAGSHCIDCTEMKMARGKGTCVRHGTVEEEVEATYPPSLPRGGTSGASTITTPHATSLVGGDKNGKKTRPPPEQMKARMKNGIQLWVHREGMVRMCALDYAPPTLRNCQQPGMHLTNYAVNKSLDAYTIPATFSDANHSEPTGGKSDDKKERSHTRPVSDSTCPTSTTTTPNDREHLPRPHCGASPEVESVTSSAASSPLGNKRDFYWLEHYINALPESSLNPEAMQRLYARYRSSSASSSSNPPSRWACVQHAIDVCITWTILSGIGPLRREFAASGRDRAPVLAEKDGSAEGMCGRGRLRPPRRGDEEEDEGLPADGSPCSTRKDLKGNPRTPHSATATTTAAAPPAAAASTRVDSRSSFCTTTRREGEDGGGSTQTWDVSQEGSRKEIQKEEKEAKKEESDKGKTELSSAFWTSASSGCFELLGFDIMLCADTLQPVLMEVNHSPSLFCETSFDAHLKKRVLTDVFQLLGRTTPSLSYSTSKARFRKAMHELYEKHQKTVQEGVEKDTTWNKRAGDGLARGTGWHQLLPGRERDEWREGEETSLPFRSSRDGPDDGVWSKEELEEQALMLFLCENL